MYCLTVMVISRRELLPLESLLRNAGNEKRDMYRVSGDSWSFRSAHVSNLAQTFGEHNKLTSS